MRHHLHDVLLQHDRLCECGGRLERQEDLAHLEVQRAVEFWRREALTQLSLQRPPPSVVINVEFG